MACFFFILAVGGSFQEVNNCKHRITPSTKWEQVKVNVLLASPFQTVTVVALFSNSNSFLMVT